MAKLEFSLDKIMSVTDARNNFNKIVEGIEKDPEGKFLLTKGGKPSVAMVNSNFLEKLMGASNVKIEGKEQSSQPQPESIPSENTPPLKLAQDSPAQPAPTVSPTPLQPQAEKENLPIKPIELPGQPLKTPDENA